MSDEPDPHWTAPASPVSDWLARTTRGDWPDGRYTEVVDLTPDVAAFLLTSVDPEHQRHERPNYWRRIGEGILRGEWRHSAAEVTFVGHPGEPGFMNMNGRNRMEGVRWAGEQDPTVSVPVTVAFGCDPDEARVTDIGLPRTLADTLDFTVGPSEPGNRNVAAAVKLAWHIEHGTWASRLPSPSRVQELEFLEHNPDIRQAVVQGLEVRKELHGPIAGYACAFWLISRSEYHQRLEDFAAGITYAEHAKRTDPVYVVRNTLLKAFADRAVGLPDQRRAWWYTAVILKGWNHFIAGKTAPGSYRFGRQDRFPTCK